ncbi:unnamed protein product [Scomber scombrus]|uniref:Unnamed protein product n=1 Tax=Scomber scombrus TaxID=13677 RepID=A0AAV1N157_SCOSC
MINTRLAPSLILYPSPPSASRRGDHVTAVFLYIQCSGECAPTQKSELDISANAVGLGKDVPEDRDTTEDVDDYCYRSSAINKIAQWLVSPGLLVCVIMLRDNLK